MTAPTVTKAPRPLSIITESSLDDILDEEIELHSKNISDNVEKTSPEHNTSRQTRRVAVAPLQHPLGELRFDRKCPTSDGHVFNPQLESEVELNSHINGNLGVTGNSVNTSSKINIYNTLNKDHLVDSITNGHIQQDQVKETEMCINYAMSTTSDITFKSHSANVCIQPSQVGTQTCAATHRQIQVSNDSIKLTSAVEHNKDLKCINESSGRSQQWTHSDTGHPRKLSAETHCPPVVGLTHSSSDSYLHGKGGLAMKSDSESREISLDPSHDPEHVDWKNRIRKSSSFTSSSRTHRPLRRSIGSLDYKNYPNAAHSGTRFGGKEKRDSVEFNNSNSKPVFYLSLESSTSSTNNVFSSSEKERKWLNVPRKYSDGSNESTLSLSADVSSSGGAAWKQLASNLHPHRRLLDNSPSPRDTLNIGDSSSSSDLCPETFKPPPGLDFLTQPPIRRISSGSELSAITLVKAAAIRHNLPTRRPSIVAWKNQVMNLGQSDHDQTWLHPLTQADRDRIDRQLSLIRQELEDIRGTDQELAKQFLYIRQMLGRLRLAKECRGHMQLLDDAEEDVEEWRQLSHLVDFPLDMMSPLSALQHLGVTRMNLSSRRFSTC